MNVRHALTDVVLKCASRTHRALLGLSGGRLGGRIGSMPVVELHTIGRRSGKPRVTTLTAPIHDDDRIVLVASKGGDDRDPDWYRNLVADPDVELTIGGVRRPFRARTASGDEKSELWARIVVAYKGYGGYQRRTERDIPVVICEPR